MFNYRIYNSLVIPCMTYCIEVWGNMYKTNTNPIFTLQKKAINAITFSTYNQPTNAILINLQTLIFYDLVEPFTLKIMFKIKI